MRKYHYPLYDATTSDDAGMLDVKAENVEDADEKALAWQQAHPGYEVDILRARSEVVPMPHLGIVEL